MTLGPVFDAALRAQGACEKLGLPFCVIGGVALQRWGEPRFTADADLSVLVEPGEEAPVIHEHSHEHAQNVTHQHKHPKDLKQSYFASFWIGILHGLAGIAHFLILLPVLGFKSQTDSLLYIVGFGSGIILAMTTFAFVMGKIASSAKAGHNDFFFNGIRLAGGLFAIVIGIYWCFSF